MRRRDAIVMLFLVTACVLAFEISLTRVCSVLLQYHVSFAVVSLAILGLGLGGFVADLTTRARPERVETVVRVALLALSPTIVLATASLLLLPFAAQWPFMLALILPVFIATGAVQSLVLRAFARHANVLYAADLAGGAAGALLSVLAIDTLGGPVNTALLLSLLTALAAWMWCRRVPSAAGGMLGARGALVWVSMSAVLLAAQVTTQVLDVDYSRAPNKLITQLMQPSPSGRPYLVGELQRWDAYSRVDVLDLRTAKGIQRMVFIDGETPTPMLEVGAAAPGEANLDISETLPALPYRLLRPQRVLSIGSGAGYDVVVAKRFGVEEIDAVELNAGVLAVVDACREFTGDVYNQPGVRSHHAEGRLFARRAQAGAYDLVIMALAQSLAGNLREFALSENYLYTREAFADYLRILREGGAVAFLLNNDALLRKLTRTAFEVLEARGLDARRCVVALSSPQESPYDQFLLVRTRPFTPSQLEAVAHDVGAHGYVARHLPSALQAEAPQLSAAELDGGARLRLTPASDDRPFFFHVFNEVPRALVILLVVSSGLLLVAWVGLLRSGGDAVAPATRMLHGGYFVCLGLGFMMVEILVLQKTILMIGFPTLNLAVVLATFLLAAGLGSAASARWGAAHPRRRLRWTLAALALALLFLLPLLQRLHGVLDPLPLFARCLLLSAALFPFAFVMGMPFPLGVRLLPHASVARVPWYWGLNGVASVLGSTIVVTVVLEAGFRSTSLLAAAAYALAIACTAGLLQSVEAPRTAPAS